MGDSNSNDFQYYRYHPSIGAAVLFVILFIAATGIHTYQLVRTRTWYFIPFVIGGYFQWVGYIGRAISGHESPNFSMGPYIQQTLLLLISPTLFAASIYMELGRIIRLTDGEEHSLVRTKWLTLTFVLGDVISFLMQGWGGGVMSDDSGDSLEKGEHIIIGGLAVQLIFFILFVITSVKFHLSIREHPTPRSQQPDIAWEKHIYALYGSSLLILVRSVFRLVEYAQGNAGYLVSHEVFLYIFDGLLMLATMVVFVWIHPSEVNALLKGGQGAKAVRRVYSVYSLA
ncbi:RTA1 like protein-domain-containing protein [Aspergillus bertholletiae]|uniref:RTA1 like protein-domain-containing protein n=1 Tax=Aspergillus bertholletiae TaxID=1226010 RepID=A0A5N7B4K4_9EURO|nr:RTA1 like protein-domain-containing protein [Aspergillus bertholletiae]